MKTVHLYIGLCIAVLLSACTKELVYETEDGQADFANGQAVVILVEPGTLWEQLSKANDLMALTSLTISGPINGTDLKLIREMAGADSVGNETRGQLVKLDLSAAQFVKGGSNPFVYESDPCPMNEDNAIPNYGFGYCKLKEICLPENISRFGSQAFFHCDSLQTVNIPKSLEEMSISTFCYCSNLNSILVFPETVTSIPDYTFYECQSLTNITLHNKITNIGSYAFYECRKITDFGSTLPALDSIAPYSFAGCYKLKQAYLPKRMTIVPERAFYFCGDIKSVDLTGKAEIDNYAFYHCTELTSVTMSEGLQTIGGYAFGKTALEGTLSLPASVREVGFGSFSETYITEVKINSDIALSQSNSVSESDTFYRCNKLRIVTITEGVTAIDLAFGFCKALTTIVLPSTLKRIGEEDDVIHWNRGYVFANCTALKTISLPEGLELLGRGAFQGCTNLKTVTFPSSLKKIDTSAFRECTSFSNITIPQQIEEIGAYAFSRCTSLSQINVLAPLKEIPQGMFEDCTALKTVSIPSMVTEIGYEAFKGSGIADITLPDGLTYIGDMAFMNCQSLTKIELPSSLKKIEDNAFFGCTNLTDVTFKDNCAIITIGNSCFYQCTSLKNIVLPSALQTIGQNVFDTSGLQSVTLPASVTTIGDGCFANCRRLAMVTNLAPQPQDIKPTVFSGILLPRLTLRVPSSVINAYQGAAVWSGFGQIMGL